MSLTVTGLAHSTDNQTAVDVSVRHREINIPGVNRMHPLWWIHRNATSLLDVGCNVGELLADCRALFPDMALAGVEVNAAACEAARRRVPSADVRVAGADALPFADDSFDCVTCIEVLEHIPEAARQASLQEMQRVLRRGGRLVLRVPHAGAFAWLDPNNFRFRFPRLYRTTVGRGRRDAGYGNDADGVVWHQHFRADDLLALAGAGWEIETIRRGGSFLFPLLEIASWPFYRMGRTSSRVFKLLQHLKNVDLGQDFGRVSDDILLVLKRT